MQSGEVIAIPIMIGTVALSVVTIIRSLLDNIRRAKSDRLQAEIYTKLIDKFGSSPELVAYLQSESGMNLLRTEAPEQPAAYSRILNAVQFGIIGSVVGGALLWLGRMFHGEAQEVLMVAGTLTLAAGGGLLLAGGAAYGLSRHLGLVDGAKSDAV